MGPRSFKYDATGNGGGGITPKKYYLLAIAIDDYGDEFKRLGNPVRDVNRIVKLLVEEYKFAKVGSTDLRKTSLAYDRHEEEIPVYSDDQNYLTNCLYNEKATTDAIIKAVEEIDKRIGPDDALVVFFSGHGVRGSNDKYYLLCADSVQGNRGSWLNISEIYSQFDNYLSKPKCRDFLLVLDACYSGLSTLGQSNRVKGDFSRFLLTSTSDEHVAADGITGRGSGFANAFLYYLDQNTAPEFEFRDSTIKSRFESSRGKGDESQKIQYVEIPGTHGQRSFVFERTEKEKPRVKDLKESFIEHLDFDEYRSTMKQYYKKGLNNLNIIVTQGYSFHVQTVGWKVVFRWLSKPAQGVSLEQPELSFTPTPVKIVKDGDIWELLYDQIKKDAEGPMKDKVAIHDWLFDKLLSGDERYAGKRHVILWIYFSLGAQQNFDRIQTFCEEFSSFFLDKMKTLSEEDKKDIGKMFIFFSDERDNAEKYSRDKFTGVSRKNEFNLITTSTVDPISSNHISEWVDQITVTNQTKLIQALKDPDKVKKMVGKDQCEDYDCMYEDFISHVSSYCLYSDTEKTLLNEYLFDFKKSLI